MCLVIGCFPRLVRALVFFFFFFFYLKNIIFKGAKSVVLLKQMAKNDIIYIYTKLKKKNLGATALMSKNNSVPCVLELQFQIRG